MRRPWVRSLTNPESKSGPKAPRVNIAPARVAASHVLLAVERGTAHSDDQLRSPRVEVLSREDRNLTTELVRGTLRWQTVLDREIGDRLKNPDMEMHLGVIIALRLGAYQLLFLDRIPAHAAVHDSVELARLADGDEATPMVNAVLRRIGREKDRMTSLRSEPAAAYPRWIVERWRARFGDDNTQRICGFGQQPPPTTVRREGEIASERLGEGMFLRQAARLLSGDAATLRIQDEASQLVGEIAAFHAGDSLLDACAAPGGKTAILAERNPDTPLHAVDASGARLRIMQRRLPWADSVRFTVTDAAALEAVPTYSTALCDMPCSGTGTLARNPEIRHRLSLDTIATQSKRQGEILTAVLKTMKPGGRVIYSTCSLEPEENEQVVEAVLALHPGVTLEPMEPLLDAMLAENVLSPQGHALLRETAISGNYLRTLPGVHACDGFFAAVLRVPQA